MNQDDIVCSCLNISYGQIKDAVDSGAHTLEQVQEATQAGTICGACLDSIEQIVHDLTDAQS